MVFFETIKQLSFSGLSAFTLIVLLAHVFRWRRFNYLHWLGVTIGLVLTIGLAEQFHVVGFFRYLAIGLSIGVFGRLFDLLHKYRPIPDVA